MTFYWQEASVIAVGPKRKERFCLSERGAERMQTTQLGRDIQSGRKQKGWRDFYKTHSSPNPYRAETLIPTGWRYPPTTRRQWILCGQKSIKEKKKEREREREAGLPPARGMKERAAMMKALSLFNGSSVRQPVSISSSSVISSITTVTSMCSLKLQAHHLLPKQMMKSDRLWMLTRKLREVIHL